MALAFRLAVGVGIALLGVLSLFGCASTTPHREDLATNSPIAAEIDPNCPYLTFQLTAPSHGNDADARRAASKIQKPYLEKFSAHLERVGFKAWKPLGERLEREGFRELGAWWTRLWPVLVDEGRWLTTDRELAEHEKIMAKLVPSEVARVEQMHKEYENSVWDVVLDVIDFGESEQIVGAVKGDRILVWSGTMNKRPTVLDGALRVDAFRDPSDRNPRRRVGFLHYTGMASKSKFGIEAAKFADRAAAVFLPHVRQLCADMSATLLEEEAALERIRDQLTEEILRVRERRAEQEKRLKLEVEQ